MISMDVMKNVVPVMREPAPVQESAVQGGSRVSVSPEIILNRPEPKRYLDADKRDALAGGHDQLGGFEQLRAAKGQLHVLKLEKREVAAEKS